MAVGGPPTQDDSVDAHRADGQNEENSDIEIGNLEDWPEGDGRIRQHAGHDGKHRSQPENPFVGAVGDDVFLEQELHGIRDWLQQAVRAHAHGSEARLHVRHDFALEQDDVAGEQRQDEHDHNGIEDRKEKRPNGVECGCAQHFRFLRSPF